MAEQKIYRILNGLRCMAKTTDTSLQEMMYNNFTRCCELTQASFEMKFAFYQSLFPNLDDNAIWEKIIEDILKRKDTNAANINK